MKTDLAGLINRLRLPSWQKADIEAELAAHLQEAAADLRVQGLGEAEAQTAALARFGDLDSLAESLQAIHQDWKGGATVQKRFFRTLSLVIIIGVLVLAAMLPNLRGLLRIITYPKLQGLFAVRPVTREKVLKKFSRDLFIQLYDTELRFRAKIAQVGLDRNSVPDEQQLKEALDVYSPVFAIDPNNPAPHQRLAMQFLQKLSLKRPEISDDRQGGSRLSGSVTEASMKERSPWERFYLKNAIEQLQTAARLSKENAAPDYLLAYCYFANQQDDLANESLRAALNKSGWNLYDAELRQAQGRLYQAQAVDALGQTAGYYARLFSTQARLRDLTRLLSKLTGSDRTAGKHGQAIFYLEASTHLGELMLEHADSMIDLLVAKALLATIGGSFISQEEKDAIRSLAISAPEKTNREIMLEEERLTAYLDAQGQAILAKRYLAAMTTAAELDSKARATIDTSMSRFGELWESRWLAHTVLIWWQALIAGAMLLLVGLLSLLLRYWREKGAAPIWRWWDWLALMLFLLLPTHYQAFRTHGTLVGEDLYNAVSSATFLIMGVSFAVWLLLVVIVALVKRARQPKELRQGKLRAGLASLRIMLLPTTAALLLGVLLISIPAQISYRRYVAQQNGLFQKGEVQYWGIGLPGGKP
jgi:hypothetical protein